MTSRRVSVVLAILMIGVTGLTAVSAQRRGTPAPAAPRGRGAAPAAPVAPTIEPGQINCPTVLGEGVQTKRSFCDVLIAVDPLAGIIVKLPPHTGDLTLRFDLHNRHAYSEDLIRANRAYRRYTATIGALTLNNDPLSMFVVQSEFRTATDLVDRVSGGAGPGGVKAVAPTGTESVSLVLPQTTIEVSIVGLRLAVVRPDGPDETFTVPGRPIAVISNVTVEYRPAPAGRPARGR